RKRPCSGFVDMVYRDENGVVVRSEIVVQPRAERFRTDAVFRDGFIEYPIEHGLIAAELGACIACIDVDEGRCRGPPTASRRVNQRIRERARSIQLIEQRGDDRRLPASGWSPNVGVRRDPVAKHRFDVVEEAFEHRPSAGRFLDMSDGTDRTIIEDDARIVTRLLTPPDARAEIHRCRYPSFRFGRWYAPTDDRECETAAITAHRVPVQRSGVDRPRCRSARVSMNEWGAVRSDQLFMHAMCPIVNHHMETYAFVRVVSDDGEYFVR